MKALTWLAVLLVTASISTLQARGSRANTQPTPQDADVVVAWNQRALTIAEAEDHLVTLKGVRAAAMMHIAMNDAINSVRRKYTPWFHATATPDADPVMAAAQAAYEVVVHEYPDQKVQLDSELARWAGPSRDAAGGKSGGTLGKAAAAAVLEHRHDDGWNREAKYQWQPLGPGVYAEFNDHSATPQGFVFGAGWAIAKPMALTKADQFRVPPPPAIDSDEYVAAYEEVRELGRYESSTRSQDQTHLALWWKEFVESSHNRLARQIVASSDTDLWTAARMFALLNAAIMDGYIASFDSKFAYNHWRPYTAIHWAQNDGNPRTHADEQWNNTHKHTYPFPSYPSAHGTACAAAMTVLTDTFGDHYAFTMETQEVDSAGGGSPKMKMQPATRSFDNFQDAAMECALSRVYLGIHFRYDSIAGNKLGKDVGGYVVDHYLKRL
jgi:membrane-associated phospholipid phosphatase